MGSIFDIRVVATTNADHVQIDQAIVREGRLCRRINVPELPAEHANTLLGELRPGVDEPIFDRSRTLAQVYALAHHKRSNSVAHA